MSSLKQKSDEKKNGRAFDFKWFQRNRTQGSDKDVNYSTAQANSFQDDSDASSGQQQTSSSSLSNLRRNRSSSKKSNKSSKSDEILKHKLSKLWIWDHPQTGSEKTGENVPFPSHSNTPGPTSRASSSKENSRESNSKESSQESRDIPRILLDPVDLRRRRRTNESRSRSSSLALSFFPSSTTAGNGNMSGTGSFGSSTGSNINGSRPRNLRSSSHDEVKYRKVLPLEPPPTIGPGALMEDKDVVALGLDPMAVRYADHLHFLGYTRNRFVCALLSKESGKEEQKYNMMVMQAFIMRMMCFHGEPLDMSLRKFLFRVVLPVESQQIERVLQNFSLLWAYHNPGIFSDDEQVLCAVFTLVMLHTDAFNKNVKRKMIKSDFVRNATIDGVVPEIFEYFYDNITAASFIADEDMPVTPTGSLNESMAILGTPGSSDDLGVPQTISEDTGSSRSQRSSSFTWLREHTVDPYPYLLENRLDALRPDLKSVSIQPDYDVERIQSVEELRAIRSQLGGSTSTVQVKMPKVKPEVFLETLDTFEYEKTACPATIAVKIIKHGTILRRETKRTFIGQKPGWREWGVLLTNSKIYLVKNAYNIRHFDSVLPDTETQISIDTLQSAMTISVNGLAAVIRNPQQDDKLWKFMLIERARDSVHHSFAVENEQELKSWVQVVNFIATQSSVGVDLQNKCPKEELEQGLRKVGKQMEDVQRRIDGYNTTLRHFQLLAPIQSRTREVLVFTAGKYYSRRDDAFGDLTRLHAYQNVLTNALLE